MAGAADADAGWWCKKSRAHAGVAVLAGAPTGAACAPRAYAAPFSIAGSALRTGKAGPFLANRALRILPALTVEVTLCALVLGPFFTTLPLRQYFSDSLFLSYFGNIVGHAKGMSDL